MADPYEDYLRRAFLNAEAAARLSEALEAQAEPVFHALAEGDLDPLIRYLREAGDIRSVPLSKPLANQLADMLEKDGRSLFRLNIIGRVPGERGREHRLRVSRRSHLIGYCAQRLIGEVRRRRNAKWAKGEVAAEFNVGKTKVENDLRLVRAYLAAKGRRGKELLNDRHFEEYDERFGQRAKRFEAKPGD